ncbi:MAG TPA: corrinoid protein [Candidatus Paceibacterota bacterium]|nr:corrinoid protein [Candidatus Paceibacterota bacterium]
MADDSFRGWQAAKTVHWVRCEGMTRMALRLGPRFSGVLFPAAVAVRDFLELAPGFVEQRIPIQTPELRNNPKRKSDKGTERIHALRPTAPQVWQNHSKRVACDQRGCLNGPQPGARSWQRLVMQEYKALHEAILSGDAATARAVTEKALAASADPLRLVNDLMVPAMDEVGRRFECNEYFVPELLISARAMKAALELIRPILIARGDEPAGRVAIGTVKGDLHDIGKNLVAAMLEGGGFEVIDLGVNVSPEQFVKAVREGKANVVAMSALLTTTMPAMKTTIEALKQAGLREKVKVLIGGAPITQKYAEEIGADGYSDNAPAAVSLAKKQLAVGA